MSDTKADSPSINKSTPPPNRRIRNPFDKALIDKLHKPICSPGMCKIYKKEHTGHFRWDIDQACTLAPADIVACNSQFEPSPDPALERIAEEATEKFSQAMVIPSPFLETSKKVKPLLYTSCDASIQIDSFDQEKKAIITREASAQTVLTLPPELPPELEKILHPFFTFTQDQDISGEYEITVNGSLCRKLFFEEHSDMEHDDSEQTDDEIHMDPRPPSDFKAHTPIVFSPDLSQDLVAKGMKRTFGTPLKSIPTASKPCYRNKILDMVDGDACPFSPIDFTTPKRTDHVLGMMSSLTSGSISPLTKTSSSDEEKNNFTSPESEAMAMCLTCVGSESDGEKKGPCFCIMNPNKVALKRSKSLKESPPRSRSSSISEKRSLSMSSLHRSRSVQKLDFSMDMSIDCSLHDNLQADSEYFPIQDKESTWSIVEEANYHCNKFDSSQSQTTDIRSSTKLQSAIILDETPIKSKDKDSVRPREICKMRVAMPLSPLEMSLDSTIDNSENPLSMEDKKIDFNTIDLKFLTENVSQFDYTANATKVGDDVTSSFKKVDSGFNENTFYANASSYYESAIKPSELTVTNISRPSGKNALKELSNVHWMRTDSGFKDENSTDSVHFYNANGTHAKKISSFHFSEAKLDNKENIEEFDKFLVEANKNEAMSMSDIFTEDMTFNCNFSSTPSKNKSRKVNS